MLRQFLSLLTKGNVSEKHDTKYCNADHIGFAFFNVKAIKSIETK